MGPNKRRRLRARQKRLINMRNESGEIPLHAAVRRGTTKEILKLIKKGADPNLECDGFYPLHLAIYDRNCEIVRLLLENGADAAATNRYGRSALIIAILKEKLDVVELLLQYGAPVYQEDVWTGFRFNCDDRICRVVTRRYLQTNKHIHFQVILKAMLNRYSGLCELLQKVKRIMWNQASIEFMVKNIARFSLLQWLNLSRFKKLIQSITEQDLIGHLIYSCSYYERNPDYYDILDLFANHPRFRRLFKERPFERPLISTLIFHGVFTTIDSVATIKIARLLVKRGVPIASVDADIVKSMYGNCELYRYLRDRLENLEFLSERSTDLYKRFKLPALFICDITKTVEQLVKIRNPCPFQMQILLEYTVLPKLTEYLRQTNLRRINRILDELPKVPSLLEYARNTSRNYLTKRFRVDGSDDYRRIIQRLPLPKHLKLVLLFERGIYKINRRPKNQMCLTGGDAHTYTA